MKGKKVKGFRNKTGKVGEKIKGDGGARDVEIPTTWET